MAVASMAKTFCRTIKFGSLSRNRLQNLTRSFSNDGTSYDVVLTHSTSLQVHPDVIPNGVLLPSYARSGRPDYSGRPTSAECHSEETVAKIRAACALAKALLTEAGAIIKPGMTTGGVGNPPSSKACYRDNL